MKYWIAAVLACLIVLPARAQEADLPPQNYVDDVTNAGTSAAAFLLTYATSDHALRDRGALAAGETLLVLGAAGGVGLAAVEIGKALGARVIACASSEEKLAVCREHGADATINYAAEDLRERIKALTDGRGVDVVYDPVGGDASRAALRCLNFEGRLITLGFASGDISRACRESEPNKSIRSPPSQCRAPR